MRGHSQADVVATAWFERLRLRGEQTDAGHQLAVRGRHHEAGRGVFRERLPAGRGKSNGVQPAGADTAAPESEQAAIRAQSQVSAFADEPDHREPRVHPGDFEFLERVEVRKAERIGTGPAIERQKKRAAGGGSHQRTRCVLHERQLQGLLLRERRQIVPRDRAGLRIDRDELVHSGREPNAGGNGKVLDDPSLVDVEDGELPSARDVENPVAAAPADAGIRYNSRQFQLDSRFGERSRLHLNGGGVREREARLRRFDRSRLRLEGTWENWHHRHG